MKNNFWFKLFSNLCICTIIVLVVLILSKAYPNFKDNFYKHVFEKNISFASINEKYKKIFGSSIPFENLFTKNTQTVFNSKIEYSEANKYKDGVKLTVADNYLVPVLKNGLVVFIGQKEEYGNTVIIQQADGIDVWYSNLESINVKMYDYVKSGDFLGEVTSNYFYLIFKKEGNVLNYQDYI
jgi:stage IV sporulation protein FA